MNKQLYHQIAVLETQVDHLETELAYINEQLFKCGFPEGIKTLKMTVEEILSESTVEISEDESEMI
jgi:hypothetical protein